MCSFMRDTAAETEVSLGNISAEADSKSEQAFRYTLSRRAVYQYI